MGGDRRLREYGTHEIRKKIGEIKSRGGRGEMLQDEWTTCKFITLGL
jgi:hypothetical protein